MDITLLPVAPLLHPDVCICHQAEVAATQSSMYDTCVTVRSRAKGAIACLPKDAGVVSLSRRTHRTDAAFNALM
jgi:hypothetical protein